MENENKTPLDTVRLAEVAAICDKEMTEEKAQLLLKKWVEILELESWDIRFKWRVRSQDMNLQDSVGCTTYKHTSKQAIIQMLDPVDFSNDMFEYDYEETLVHELLHLKFADIDDSENELQNKLLHQLVDSLAKSFIKAKEF